MRRDDAAGQQQDSGLAGVDGLRKAKNRELKHQTLEIEMQQLDVATKG
jgi:hypothetical protein